MATNIDVICSGAIGATLGVVIGMISSIPPNEERREQAVVVEEQVSDARVAHTTAKPQIDVSNSAKNEQLQKYLQLTKEALVAARAEIDELNRKLQTSSPAVQSSEELTATSPAPPTEDGTGDATPRQVLALDGWRAREEFKDVDWHEAGDTLRQLAEFAFREDLALQSDTLSPIARQQIALQRQLRERLPSQSKTIDTSLSHPFPLVNILGDVLDMGGVGFSITQTSLLEDIGKEYEQAWKRQDQSYTEDTIALTKVLDELELKQQAFNRVVGILTDEQAEFLFTPSRGEQAGLLVGPIRDLRTLTSLAMGGELSPSFITGQILVAEWGLPVDVASQCQWIAAQWFDAVSSDITDFERGFYNPVFEHGVTCHDARYLFAIGASGPTPETLESQRIEFERLMRFGRAQVQVIEQLLRTPGLPKAVIGQLTVYEKVFVFAYLLPKDLLPNPERTRAPAGSAGG